MKIWIQPRTIFDLDAGFLAEFETEGKATTLEIPIYGREPIRLLKSGKLKPYKGELFPLYQVSNILPEGILKDLREAVEVVDSTEKVNFFIDSENLLKGDRYYNTLTSFAEVIINKIEQNYHPELNPRFNLYLSEEHRSQWRNLTEKSKSLIRTWIADQGFRIIEAAGFYGIYLKIRRVDDFDDHELVDPSVKLKTSADTLSEEDYWKMKYEKTDPLVGLYTGKFSPADGFIALLAASGYAAFLGMIIWFITCWC